MNKYIFLLLKLFCFFVFLFIYFLHIEYEFYNIFSNSYYNKIDYIYLILNSHFSINIYVPIIFLLYGFKNKKSYIYALSFLILNFLNFYLYSTQTDIFLNEYHLLNFIMVITYLISFHFVILKIINIKCYIISVSLLLSIISLTFFITKNNFNEEKYRCLNSQQVIEYCLSTFRNHEISKDLYKLLGQQYENRD